MKKSKAETADTRRQIVRTAASEFRRKGIHAAGLAELMAAAGLTHGGFYRHFGSKDQLIAEAIAQGMDDVVGNTANAAQCGSGRVGLAAIIEGYLSPHHKDDSSTGCPLAGLGSELARADEETRTAATAGFEDLVNIIAGQFNRAKPDDARARAVFALSAMIGGVTMARIVNDPVLSDAILRQVKDQLVHV